MTLPPVSKRGPFGPRFLFGHVTERQGGSLQNSISGFESRRGLSNKQPKAVNATGSRGGVRSPRWPVKPESVGSSPIETAYRF